jgi:hypothetical protein
MCVNIKQIENYVSIYNNNNNNNNNNKYIDLNQKLN